MSISSRTVDKVAILEIRGRFDSKRVSIVGAWIDRAASMDPPYIVINLEQVTFIDTEAVSKLVQGMKRCRQHGGDLRLGGASPHVREVLELTNLDHAFAVFESEMLAVSTSWAEQCPTATHHYVQQAE